jgi:integrase
MLKAITKRTIDAMKPGDIVADETVEGFVARCLPSGKITYGFRYRQRSTGKRRWIALGLHGQLTPEGARTIAQKHAGIVADGGDPLGAKVEARAKAKTAKTVSDVIDRYMTEHVHKNKLRSAVETGSFFDRLVKPKIGKVQVLEIRKSQIKELIDGIAHNNGKMLAFRMLAHIRGALNWYEAKGDPDNFRAPVFRKVLDMKARERKRTRTLTESELREIWAALKTDKINPTFAAIVRVLTLTAQRRDEITCMEWGEISKDRLVIPASRYKTNIKHLVPLTDKVLEIIRARPKINNCPFVFTTNGKTQFQGFSKCKIELDIAINAARKAEGIDDEMPSWRLHDLRRTGRTLMAKAGVESEVAERVLGHIIQGIEGVYNLHDYEAEKREALEKLGAAIERILNPTTGNVVELKAKKSANGGGAI